MRAVALLCCVLAVSAAPAEAAVESSSPSGFSIRHELVLEASPEVAWKAIARPGEWWPKDHTWSGDASKLSLELTAGGCFCERWAATGGSAMHARVLIVRERELLRMDAPLGPLQELGVSAVLSVSLAADGDQRTRAIVTFRVSGDPSHGLDKLAPVVDRVVGQQWGGWVRYAGELGKPNGDPPPPDVN